MEIALGLIAGIGILAIFIGVYFTVIENTLVEQRLREYTQATTLSNKPANGGGTAKSPLGDRLERSFRSNSMGRNLALSLERADLKMTPSEFMALTAIIIVAIAFVSIVLLNRPAVALIGVVVGFYGPRFWLYRRKLGRIRSFNNQLADGIGLMSSSLRSGYSVAQSFELVARDARAPLSIEFARVNREVNLGISPNDALGNVLTRVPSEDFDLLVTAVNIQREVGGNLAEILDSIADTIRDRVKLLGEVRVLTSQQSLAGYVVSLLPVLLGAGLFAINPRYMMGMFSSFFGWIALGCASIGIIAGFFIMRKIVDIKV